jgi:hypothetical protein
MRVYNHLTFYNVKRGIEIYLICSTISELTKYINLMLVVILKVFLFFDGVCTLYQTCTEVKAL